jgi:O-antigen/teichoic acid export membrane protein
MVGATLVADDGIPLLIGEKWRPVVIPFRMLSIVGVASLFSAVLLSLLNAIGRPEISFKYTAVNSVLFPLTFFLAGKSFGVIGVCVVWMIMYPIVVIGLFAATRCLTGIKSWDLSLSLVPTVCATIVMVGVVSAVHNTVLSSRPIDRFLIDVVAGVGSYSLCILWAIRCSLLPDVSRVLQLASSRLGSFGLALRMQRNA